MEPLAKSKIEELASGTRDKDTMVVLYAPWCQFSQGLEPAFEEFAAEAKSDKLRVAKYQADVDKEWSQSIGLTTYPTLLYMPLDLTRSSSTPRTVARSSLSPCGPMLLASDRCKSMWQACLPRIW